MIIRKLLFTSLCLAALTTSYAQQQLSLYDSLRVMPAFRYYQLNGRVFVPDSLDDENQTVIVYFKKDCPFCERQAEIISNHLNNFPSNVEFLFIAKEDTDFINGFALKYKLGGSNKIKFLRDKERLYFQYCNPSYTPSIHIYSEKRKLIQFHEGVMTYKELLQQILGSI